MLCMRTDTASQSSTQRFGRFFTLCKLLALWSEVCRIAFQQSALVLSFMLTSPAAYVKFAPPVPDRATQGFQVESVFIQVNLPCRARAYRMGTVRSPNLAIDRGTPEGGSKVYLTTELLE